MQSKKSKNQHYRILIGLLLFFLHYAISMMANPEIARHSAAAKDSLNIEAGKITGTVTAEDGGFPIASSWVVAYRYNISNWQYHAGVFTNAAGSYSFTNLPPGTYRIGFSSSTTDNYIEEYYDNEPDLDSADDVDVTSGNTTAGIDATLVEQGRISGTVAAADTGLPISNIAATAYYLTWRWFSVATAFTDSNGQYDIGGLDPRNYRVRFGDSTNVYVEEWYDDALEAESGTDIAVTAASTTTNVDALLSPAGHIAGTVTAENGGTPVYDAVMYVKFNDGTEWQTAGFIHADQNGNYDVGRLKPGNYRVYFGSLSDEYASEYFNNVLDIESATDISVTGHNTTAGIDAALAVAGHITGTVTSSSSGLPLFNMEATAYHFNGSDWVAVGSSTTDSGGQYDIARISAGTYRIGFSDSNNGAYLDEYYDDVQDVDSATDVALSAGGATANIDAALATGGRISGTVTRELDGRPLFQIYTCAFVYHNAGWELTRACGYTSPTGAYDIGGLPTGTYRLKFYDPNEWYRVEYFNNSVEIETATDISVTAGSTTTGIDAILELSEPVTVSYPLISGWNMISSPVDPYFLDLETLLADIEGDMIMVKNGNGAVYWPAMSINTIGNWNKRDGYQIYMDFPATLSIFGQLVVPEHWPFNVQPGWSLVAYLRNSPMAVDQALTSISSGLILAKNGRGEVYWPAFSVNQIGDLQPGEGYQLYLDRVRTLTYPPN